MGDDILASSILCKRVENGMHKKSVGGYFVFVVEIGEFVMVQSLSTDCYHEMEGNLHQINHSVR